MNVQKAIDNHYMHRLSRNAGGSTKDDYERHSEAMRKIEESLIADGSDMALGYITAPQNEMYCMTSMGKNDSEFCAV